MVAGAGGAPAVTTWTPGGTRPRSSGPALARPIRTVGAAHIQVTPSLRTNSNTRDGSTFRRHTWVAPTAVTVQVNVHPFAWNMGRVHRYRSSTRIGRCRSVPTTLNAAFRCVIITPFGRAVVPLV